MHFFRRRILSSILLVSLAINGLFLYRQRQATIVETVLDGDTFQLPDGDRVRLLGVNAPEKGRCGYGEATDYLRQLVTGKSVRVAEERRDTYGRRLGLVYAGGRLVNAEMLRSGWARPDYSQTSQSDRLKAAYREATEAKFGVHSVCKLTSPTPDNPKCVIKGNIDKASWDHLYHLPNCRHYDKIVLDLDLGEQFFCSETEAKAAGFTLAPDCLR